MQIKMLKSTNCDGQRVQVGDVVDASNRDGRFLVSLGFAELYEKPKRKKSAPVNRMDEAETYRDAG